MASLRLWLGALFLISACGSESPKTAILDGGGSDRGIDLAPLPPAALRLLLPGTARLVGNGATTCSHEIHAGPTDIWCAFTKGIDGADAGEIRELWVINATRAASGETITCDGTSPSCRRLHPNLWQGGALGGPIFPSDDHFEGDTLIFYADGVSTKPDGIYQGPIWAWRPGWAEARVISSDKGLFCFGHLRAPVAFCVENVFQGPPIQFDLRAGRLVDGQNSLPLLASGVHPWKEGQLSWHAEFSPDGSAFALSAVEPSTDGEVLLVGKTAELATTPLREIAYDATSWRISLDGKKIYYLQGFTSEPKPGGKLMMADFPSGTGAVMLQPSVAEYRLLGEPGDIDRGLGLYQDRSQGLATYRVMLDRARPSELITVAEAVDDVFASPDGRFGAYVKVDDRGYERVYLARTDGKPPCVLNALPNSSIFGLHFLDDSSTLFWSESNMDVADEGAEGWVARTDGCTNKQRFAKASDFVATIADRILVFGHVPKDQIRYVLEYAHLGPPPMPVSPATVIAGEIDATVGVVPGERGAHLVIQLPDGPPQMQGVYLYGPLGF